MSVRIKPYLAWKIVQRERSSGGGINDISIPNCSNANRNRGLRFCCCSDPNRGIGLGEVEENQKEERRGFKKYEIELEANSAYQTGFPEDAEEATRFASELSVGWGLSKVLELAAGVVLTKERGDGLTASNVAIEATYSPPIFFKTDPGAGFFLALEPRIDDDATNEFIFGPIFELDVEGLPKITVNTFLEDTFGRNSEEGLAFAYGWQVQQELPKGFAIGLEGFGEIEDVFGSPPSFDDQEHRLGPVIFLEDKKIFGKEFEASFGVLAGITGETPDVAFKFNFAISFGGSD